MITLPNTPVPCASAPKLFFPPDGERSSSKARKDRIRQAAELCQRCPIRPQCVTQPRPGEEGVWGGLDEKARARAEGRRFRTDRTRRVPAACGTGSGAKAHRRRGEKACQSCLTGEQREWQERAARKLAAT